MRRAFRLAPGYVEHLRHCRGGVALFRPTSILSKYDDEDLEGDALGD